MFAGRFSIPLILTSVLFIGLGVLLSPDRLASLGLMDRSLASDIPLVRATALLEISIAKRSFLVVGAVLLLVGLFWGPIVRSRSYHRFAIWDLHPPAAYDRALRTVWNQSFRVMLAMFVLSALYLEQGNAWFSPDMLNWINREDGGIETASAILLFLAGLLSLGVAIRARGMLPRTLMHGFLALLFVVMCGEEISWGQRYFGFETPENLKALNVQEEINFHNMFGYLFDHLFILFFFLWGCVVPLLYKYSLVLRQLFRMIGLPIPSFGLAIGMLFITLGQEQVVFKFTDGVVGLRIPELRELLSAVAFVLLMRESWRGLISRR